MASKNKWVSLALGVALILFGMWVFVTPEAILLGLTLILSIGMILYGVCEIFLFVNKKEKHYSTWMLASGIISTLFGIWLTFIPSGRESMAIILPMLFAFWIMMSGVIRIMGAFSAKKQGLRHWVWLLVLGIIAVALGFFMMFSPLTTWLTLSFIIGAVLIWNGIMSVAMFFIGEK